MRTEMKFVELHSPMFLGGKNFGLKLDHKKHPDLHMEYDEDKRQMFFTYKDAAGGVHIGRVPEASVLVMVEGTKTVVTPIKPQPMPKIEAQAETPQGHVFAGVGKGQTGLGTKVK